MKYLIEILINEKWKKQEIFPSKKRAIKIAEFLVKPSKLKYRIREVEE